MTNLQFSEARIFKNSDLIIGEHAIENKQDRSKKWNGRDEY